MKKIATIIAATALLSLVAGAAFAAAPLFTEDFNYPLGTALNGTGGWSAHSSAGTNAQKVNAAGLVYAGYPSSGIGNALGTLAASGEDNNHTFTGVTAGSVYAAFMVNVVTATNTGDYFFHFFDGAIGSNIFIGRVFVKNDASGKYSFGLNDRSTAGTLVYTSPLYTYGSTHLLVVKYNYNTSATNDESVQLFIDPVVSCSEPSSNLSSSDASFADATNIDGVAIRQGGSSSGGTMQVDGINVANNWIDAVCGGGVVPTHTSTWGQVKSLYR